MSEDHSSGSGMGKTIVLLIFGVMVGFYGVNVMKTGDDASHDAHAPTHEKHTATPKFTAADYESIKAERDAALVKVAQLTKELGTTESRAVESEYRLGRVRNLLVAEDRVSGK